MLVNAMKFLLKKYNNRTELDKEKMLVEKTSNSGIISEKHFNVCLKGKQLHSRQTVDSA